jgi:phosphoribosylaminoimidazolecarboxamide formyltransferase/IMP cyclohydrolase
VDVGIREGATAIIQPGGSIRDFESIQACNEADVTMVYTGERSFKH